MSKFQQILKILGNEENPYGENENEEKADKSFLKIVPAKLPIRTAWRQAVATAKPLWK